jgi:hypothetical protein
LQRLQELNRHYLNAVEDVNEKQLEDIISIAKKKLGNSKIKKDYNFRNLI